MLTKTQIIRLCLTLIKAGDADLLTSNDLLAGYKLSDEDKKIILDIASKINAICGNYAFVDSLQFELNTASKSQSVIDMHKKIEGGSERRAQRTAELHDAIRGVLSDSQPLRLLAKRGEGVVVDQLVSLFNQLNLPD